MSKFGSAFKTARKSGAKEFDFGGKKYNTKMKADAPKVKASSNSGPKSGAPMPKSRASAVSGMAKGKPSFSGLSNVAATAKSAAKSSKTPVVTRTPAQRDIAKSKAYTTNLGANGKTFGGPVSDMMGGLKKASQAMRSKIKMGK